MKITKFIWKNGHMLPWEEATVHILTHGLHYGSSVFEGIRFYKTEHGSGIFKLREHIARLFYSAQQLQMTIPYTLDEVVHAVTETVRVNEIAEGYIRPLACCGYGSMRVVPDAAMPVDVAIACWSWDDQVQRDCVDVKTSSYMKTHPKSTVIDAKISGNYVNSILAGLAIKNTKYHSTLLMDSEGYVAEGSLENIFIVKNGKLLTTPAGTILDGITRNTVMDIAKYSDIPVKQTKFSCNDLINADEAFFCGTAVEITAIRSIDDRLIASGEPGPITKKIKSIFSDITQGKLEEFYNSLTLVGVN